MSRVRSQDHAHRERPRAAWSRRTRSRDCSTSDHAAARPSHDASRHVAGDEVPLEARPGTARRWRRLARGVGPALAGEPAHPSGRPKGSQVSGAPGAGTLGGADVLAQAAQRPTENRPLARTRPARHPGPHRPPHAHPTATNQQFSGLTVVRIRVHLFLVSALISPAGPRARASRPGYVSGRDFRAVGHVQTQLDHLAADYRSSISAWCPSARARRASAVMSGTSSASLRATKDAS